MKLSPDENDRFRLGTLPVDPLEGTEPIGLNGKAETIPAYEWQSIEAALAEPDEKFSDIWPGYVAAACLALFVAAAKAGKTWILYAWIASLVNNTGWLGAKPLGRKVKVLVVTEEPKRFVKKHARRFGIKAGLYFLTLDKMPPGASIADITVAANAYAKTIEADVIVYDTISTLAGIENENDASQVNAALKPISIEARRTGIAQVVVHHLGSGGAIRGSTAFRAVPDELVEIERVGAKGSRKRSLTATGRLGDEERTIVVEYVRDGGEGVAGFRLVVPASERDPKAERELARVTRTDAGIEALLERHRNDGDAAWLTRPALTEGTGLAVNDVKERLPTLSVVLGRIQRIQKPGRSGGYVYAAPGVSFPTWTREERGRNEGEIGGRNEEGTDEGEKSQSAGKPEPSSPSARKARRNEEGTREEQTSPNEGGTSAGHTPKGVPASESSVGEVEEKPSTAELRGDKP